MIIYGNKIALRAIELQDAKVLLEMINDPNIEMMVGGSSFPVSYDMQCKWIEEQYNGTDFRAIITKKDDLDIALGTIILTDIDFKNATAEVHIKLATNDVRGKGYATDALNALLKYSFNQLRLNCVYAQVLEHNCISINLFKKCGFKVEGTLKSRVYKNGKFINVISFSKLKDDKN